MKFRFTVLIEGAVVMGSKKEAEDHVTKHLSEKLGMPVRISRLEKVAHKIPTGKCPSME